jgi:hypothetical protein
MEPRRTNRYSVARLEPIPFDQFRDSLQPVGAVAVVAASTRAAIQEAADALSSLPEVNRDSLAAFIHEHPAWVPILGLCCRLSQERLKSALQHGLKTSGWVTLARNNPESVIQLLDEQFDLVAEVIGQRERRWTFADVLVERQSSRTNAAGTVSVGRVLENLVEELVKSLGLPYEMRVEFVGRGGRTAPADVAIPAGGTRSEIVIGIKSFGSTGSKQTDAAREFEEMAEVRDRQFAFGFCDGIGWLRRQSDLRRILALWEQRRLSGVYNLSMMAEFKAALEDAARRTGLLPAS